MRSIILLEKKLMKSTIKTITFKNKLIKITTKLIILMFFKIQ